VQLPELIEPRNTRLPQPCDLFSAMIFGGSSLSVRFFTTSSFLALPLFLAFQRSDASGTALSGQPADYMMFTAFECLSYRQHYDFPCYMSGLA
jgi:hypothetical protein